MAERSPPRQASAGGRADRGELKLLEGHQHEEWAASLRGVGLEGGFHSLGYHRLAEANGEGVPRLAVYTEGSHVVTLPLLLRPLGECVPGADGWDATSVYGYAGTLTSTPRPPDDVLDRFRRALDAELRRAGIVTVFARLNPLRDDQRAVIGTLGEIVELGPVVVIDLAQPEEAQQAAYRKSRRREVRRARDAGYVCVEDSELAHLPAVVDLYLDTMVRTGAADRYHWDVRYFEQLMSELGGAARLFVCQREGEVVSGSVYLIEGCDVHSHLGGSIREMGAPSPASFETDAVRRWASEQGYRWLNLGGGVGSSADSLLDYKLAFSSTTRPFCTWRWIIDEAAYEDLCRHRGRRADHPFFPAYRSPA